MILRFHLFARMCRLLGKNQKGMAIIMVLSSLVFVVLLIQETIFETQVEHRSATAELNSLKAYYAAKSGMEINLLRVKTYMKIMKAYSSQVQDYQAYIDLIWKFPIHWPPAFIEDGNSIYDEEVAEIRTDTLMKASYMNLITPTNGLIDINDLASPVTSLRDWTFQVLYRLIIILQSQNKTLAKEMGDVEIRELLANIKDWVDPDNTSGKQNSLLESRLYEENGLPPNHSFINLEELRQVAGMTDTLHEAITPFLTVYGEKGLNINNAPIELIQALHDNFPLPVAEEIVNQSSNPIQLNLFTKASFSDFLVQGGFEQIKRDLFDNLENISYLNFDAPHNFQLQSTGLFGQMRKNLTAVYVSIHSLLERFDTLMTEEKKREEQRRGQVQISTPKSEIQPEEKKSDATEQEPLPLEPFIIYWKESS